MELFRALGALSEPPRPETDRLAALLGLGRAPTAEEYTDLFLFQLYPYASIYLGPEGMLGGEARDRIAGYWRALAETPPAEPDHLAVMLALYARLCELEGAESDPLRRAAAERARAAFLWEHLLSWLPPYLAKLCEIAPPPYAMWGGVLDDSLVAEAKSVRAPSDALPLHLREARALADPATEGWGAFLDGLLAPISSGLILARADLARAARELGLGLRAGERRFMLRSLLEQDAPAVLEWLGREAVAWGERHARREDTLGEIARYWAERAGRTSQLIHQTPYGEVACAGS